MKIEELLSRFGIAINQSSIKAPGHAASIYPGTPNHIAVALLDDGIEDVHCELRVESPDGRLRWEQAPLAIGHRAEFQLGPLAAPAVYDFRAGVVYRKGYRLTVVLCSADQSLGEVSFVQGLTREREAERLVVGDEPWIRYNDGYIPEGESECIWNPFYYSGRPMNPPIAFRLSPAVLLDQNQVTLCFRLRQDARRDCSLLAPIAVRLLVTDSEDNERQTPNELTVESEWREHSVDVSDWEPGHYRFELQPLVGGMAYEGPVLSYHRAEPNPDSVVISPLAPYALKRDRTRDDWRMDDFSRLSLPPGWKVSRSQDAVGLLQPDPGEHAEPLVLSPNLDGHYAVFIEGIGDAYLQLDDGLVRKCNSGGLSHGGAAFGDAEASSFRWGGVFVHAADMTAKALKLLPHGTQGSGYAKLHFVPVTQASVDAFKAMISEPSCKLCGIDDWWCFFTDQSRLHQDQFQLILQGQQEIGIKSIAWSWGRSVLSHPTKIAGADTMPSTEPSAAELRTNKGHYKAWKTLANEFNAAQYACDHAAKNEVTVWAWLPMNIHTKFHGKPFRSRWIESHPEFYRYEKGSQIVDKTRVEFFFAETRQERLNILQESLAYGPDGLLVCCSRQAPMAGYNPTMVAAYQQETGVDANAIDLADGQVYHDWIAWRAGHFTKLMRELRAMVREEENKQGRAFSIGVRVPAEGLFMNLAMGMDVKGWMAEGLIDRLLLTPVMNNPHYGSQDVTPYLALGRKHQVSIWGGVNGSAGFGGFRGHFSPVAALRRCIGLSEAGVDGIEIYEGENYAMNNHKKWLVPLVGRPDLAKAYLASSNLEAVYPVDATNAIVGHDNHWWYGFSPYGTETLPRGMNHFL